MTVVVATTIAPWKCDGRQELAWLDEAEDLSDSYGGAVEFFAALEVDGRGLEPYKILFDRVASLEDMGHRFASWRFAIDDNTTVTESSNRLVRICAGRNLCHEYAVRNRAVSHLLLVDSDIRIPGNAIDKLREIDHPVVGGHVPIYCLNGPKLDPVDDWICRVGRDRRDFPGTEAGGEAWRAEAEFCRLYPRSPMPLTWPNNADVREHWNTAGFLLVRRDVFSTVAWHYDPDRGNSDDPAFQNAVERAGFGRTWVRHDVIADHEPIAAGMVAIEERGADMVRVPW